MTGRWPNVSQVKDEIHRLVRASGTAAEPARFKQIVRPMIDYMYSSMPKLQQALARPGQHRIVSLVYPNEAKPFSKLSNLVVFGLRTAAGLKPVTAQS
ncbi:MAG: hypothetical protein FRX49_11646 [Trebouxia sp. A1-2]|nr:MAG: hypothetical protein FRX49_11646 [Trebouxia sp. A1-2]